MPPFQQFCVECFVDVKRADDYLSIQQLTDGGDYYTLVLRFYDSQSSEVAETVVHWYDGYWHIAPKYSSELFKRKDKQYLTFYAMWDDYLCGYFDHAIEQAKLVPSL